MLRQTIECITFEYLLNRFFLKIPFSHATFPCSIKPKTLIRLIHHNQKQFAKLNVISKNIILNFEIFSIHEKKYEYFWTINQIFDDFKLKMLEHHVHGKHFKVS